MTIFLILILVLLLILGGAWYAYSIAFYAPKSRRVTPEEPLNGAQYDAVSEHIFRMTHIMEKIPFEEVTVTSHDGLTLRGRYYHMKDDAPIEILFHGYRSHAFRDCSGGHALSRKMGFNALVVDQRAHGESDGNTISFGIQERHDVQSWIAYINKRFGKGRKIILSGLSMGAATVLMASALELSENVVCIVADSPYSSPREIIEKVAADQHFPVAICRPFLHLGALIYGKFNLNKTSAIKAVRHAAVPILLLHGEDDLLVPCSMTVQISAACSSPVTVHTFPTAGHGLCYITDPRRYERAVYDFFCQIPELKDAMSETFTKQLFQN